MRRKWQPTPVFCLGKTMDRGAYQPRVHGVTKTQTQVSADTYTQVFVGGENRAVNRVLKNEKKHFLSSWQRLQALGVVGARPTHSKTRG